VDSINKFGRATRGERPVYALYDTADGEPAVGDVWGVGDSSFKLRKYLPGFVVLEQGAGGLVLVLHQHFVHVWGKNDAALAYNSTGVTVSVWQNGWGADVTGQDLTLVLPPPQFTEAGTGEIAANKFCRVAVRADGRYYVDLGPC
jgi:hypothetical protein